MVFQDERTPTQARTKRAVQHITLQLQQTRQLVIQLKQAAFHVAFSLAGHFLVIICTPLAQWRFNWRRGAFRYRKRREHISAFRAFIEQDFIFQLIERRGRGGVFIDQRPGCFTNIERLLVNVAIAFFVQPLADILFRFRNKPAVRRVLQGFDRCPFIVLFIKSPELMLPG